jgi:hypothetical protein
MSCPSKKKHVLGWWLGAAVLVVVDAFVPVLSGLLTCLTPQKKMSWVGGLVLSYWLWLMPSFLCSRQKEA